MIYLYLLCYRKWWFYVGQYTWIHGSYGYRYSCRKVSSGLKQQDQSSPNNEQRQQQIRKLIWKLFVLTVFFFVGEGMVTVIIHLDFSWMLRVVVDVQDDFLEDGWMYNNSTATWPAKDVLLSQWWPWSINILELHSLHWPWMWILQDTPVTWF